MTIRSGLPYSKENLHIVYEKGAVVDMADVKFPTCKTLEENYHAAITYLRNTNFEVTRDYKEMDYARKVALLSAYLNTKVKFGIPELDYTWLSILYACAGEKVESLLKKSILNELELITFTSDQFSLCKKVWDFVASLPLYAISRLDLKLDEDEKPFETTDEEFQTTNLMNIMKLPEFAGLYEFSDQLEPKFYTKNFTMENTELFEALGTLPFMVALNGIVEAPVNEYKEFTDNIKKAYQECLQK